MNSSFEPYVAIGITILIVIGMAGSMLIVAHLFGPRGQHGPVKDSPYESGMPIVVDTERRFNIRFYIVAMMFLLFDVEVVVMWPWALAFYELAANGATIRLEDGTLVGKGFLLVGMGIFFVLLVFGLVYEWLKGAFEWN